MITTKQKKWIIGKSIEKAKNHNDILNLADLQFAITHEQVIVRKKAIPDIFAISRNDVDRVFGLVKSRYELIQTKDLSMYFNDICKFTKSQLKFAGIIKQGQTVWMAARVPESITINTKKIYFYMMLSNIYDGKHAGHIMFTPVVEGENILTASRGICENKISFSHHVNFIESITPDLILQHKTKYVETMSKIFHQMASRKITDQERERFFKIVVLDKKNEKNISTKLINKIKHLNQYYETHESMTGMQGNVFGLFYAVAGYYHNVKTYDEGSEKKFGNIFYEGDALRDTLSAFHNANMMI